MLSRDARGLGFRRHAGCAKRGGSPEPDRRVKAPSPAKTTGQPRDAPVSTPNGAPNESDISSPETTIASQVARLCGGAPLPTKAYTEGVTPAAAAPAVNLAASSQMKVPQAAVSRLAAPNASRQQINIRARPIRSAIVPRIGALSM